jgi:acyl-CoA-binding protein
MSLTPYQT